VNWFVKSLETEIRKWLKRAEETVKNIELIDKSRSQLLDNIHAYIKDSHHFLEKGQLIEAFEAVIWAWSWIEILEELNVLKINHRKY